MQSLFGTVSFAIHYNAKCTAVILNWPQCLAFGCTTWSYMYKQPLISTLQCCLKIVNKACAPVSVMPFAVIRSNDCRHSCEHCIPCQRHYGFLAGNNFIVRDVVDMQNIFAQHGVLVKWTFRDIENDDCCCCGDRIYVMQGFTLRKDCDRRMIIRKNECTVLSRLSSEKHGDNFVVC